MGVSRWLETLHRSPRQTPTATRSTSGSASASGTSRPRRGRRERRSTHRTNRRPTSVPSNAPATASARSSRCTSKREPAGEWSSSPRRSFSYFTEHSTIGSRCTPGATRSTSTPTSRFERPPRCFSRRTTSAIRRSC
ncbi:hypothetical protein BM92_14530 [Haloferax mediterranei ATCC 33500]|uniref:Uncharacterized protein n=1 Tax=Haloferax mediterranei (strain ATCC 33500 / DSM 1411 / JCM 8866 / NBRC 14739 / NCIMB 2177 / R-4) TaxID=523841 RepID=A0A059TV98_HALMT|nr:hypothetical protein BM92_14530 [Haloferax mediterranei ATCC 33500]